MTQSPTRPVRLATAEEGPEHVRHGRGVVTLTIEEIRRGRVRLTAENDESRGVDERLVRLLGEETLLAAVQSALYPGERPKRLKLHLELLSQQGSDGPLESVASAARLGARVSIATVVIRAGHSVIGRGGLVSAVVHTTATSDPFLDRTNAV